MRAAEDFETPDGRQKLIWAGDLIGRAGLIAYFSFVVVVKGGHVLEIIGEWGKGAREHRALWLMSEIAVLLFAGMMILTALFRFRSIRTSEGIEPRATALAGMLMLGSLAVVPAQPAPPMVAAIGLALITLGFALSVYVVTWLGRSFTVMPAAKRLVTGGPYRFIRHPLYLAEEVAVIGVVLLHYAPLAVALAIVQWMLQLRRMHNEEKVLREAFPEYREYAQRTPKLIPKM